MKTPQTSDTIKVDDQVCNVPDDGQVRTVSKIDRVGADVRVYFQEGGFAQWSDLRKLRSVFK